MTKYSGFKGSENIEEFNFKEVRPYGDTYNDGMVQLSFTLPVPSGPRAEEAAKVLLIHMGLKDPSIVYQKDLGEGYGIPVLHLSQLYGMAMGIERDKLGLDTHYVPVNL